MAEIKSINLLDKLCFHALFGKLIPVFHISPDNAFHFPKKGINDVVKISGMRSLTAFTVCLWMNSSNTQGTLLSYAVSGQGNDNELVIDYNGNLRLLIDNTNR